MVVLEEALSILSSVSSMCVAVGTIVLAIVTYRSAREMRVERLKESFIGIVGELYKVGSLVDEDLKRLNELEKGRVRVLAHTGMELDKEKRIRVNLEIHYRKGIGGSRANQGAWSRDKKYNGVSIEYSELR